MWSFQITYMIPIRRARASVLPCRSASNTQSMKACARLPVGLLAGVEEPVERATLLVLGGAAAVAGARDGPEATPEALHQPLPEVRRAGLGPRRALRLRLVGRVVLEGRGRRGR